MKIINSWVEQRHSLRLAVRVWTRGYDFARGRSSIALREQQTKRPLTRTVSVARAARLGGFPPIGRVESLLWRVIKIVGGFPPIGRVEILTENQNLFCKNENLHLPGMEEMSYLYQGFKNSRRRSFGRWCSTSLWEGGEREVWRSWKGGCVLVFVYKSIITILIKWLILYFITVLTIFCLPSVIKKRYLWPFEVFLVSPYFKLSAHQRCTRTDGHFEFLWAGNRSEGGNEHDWRVWAGWAPPSGGLALPQSGNPAARRAVPGVLGCNEIIYRR